MDARKDRVTLVLSPNDRQRIHKVLATLATFRLRMKEAGKTAAKLGIHFRELKREAERLYDNLREMIHGARKWRRERRAPQGAPAANSGQAVISPAELKAKLRGLRASQGAGPRSRARGAGPG